MIATRKPSGEPLLGGLLVRCTVCNFPLRPKRTPKGGEYQTNRVTTTINSETVGYNDDRSGCPFCGSPFWDGGKAGDLLNPW